MFKEPRLIWSGPFEDLDLTRLAITVAHDDRITLYCPCVSLRGRSWLILATAYNPAELFACQRVHVHQAVISGRRKTSIGPSVCTLVPSTRNPRRRQLSSSPRRCFWDRFGKRALVRIALISSRQVTEYQSRSKAGIIRSSMHATEASDQNATQYPSNACPHQPRNR